MRKAPKLAAVLLAAASMIGASASMAAAYDGNTTVVGSSCKFAQGNVIILHQGGCLAVSGSDSPGAVIVSDGSENRDLQADRTKPDGNEDEGSSAAAAAAAAAAASSSSGNSSAAASAAAAASSASSGS
ncbi:hypothetical protein ACF08M_28845 [Streptomyces sp. NPDC015032]|uniref:hypothetical protein n=1 Tax=Streptomyces sp. NPDC015032 TaxID=3364937 RepID=UPI0037003C8F